MGKSVFFALFTVVILGGCIAVPVSCPAGTTCSTVYVTSAPVYYGPPIYYGPTFYYGPRWGYGYHGRRDGKWWRW